MRSFVLAAVAAAATAISPDSIRSFEDFKKAFGRKYSTQEENEHRRNVFEENLAMIDAENSKSASYRLGVTNFADLTYAEWRSQYLTGFLLPKKNGSFGMFRTPARFMESDAVDWVAAGAVTPVKNQAQCGSCWSFSTTGALEGASFIAGRGLTSLSEQNILDCDTGGSKCQGGSMDQAFGWVAENGLCSEADDTYKCADQSSSECTSSTCPTDCAKILQVGDVTGHTDVDQTEGALEAAVTQQPVSIAIEADKPEFQHYTGGVLTGDACGDNLDHGVLLVGYGAENGQKYWKVKNSWGSSFGESGYIRIARGASEEGGECGVRKAAVFPTVKPNSLARSKNDLGADKFEDFMKQFSREYPTIHEKEHRRNIFKQNLAMIEAVNAKGKSYTLGVTNFADLTVDEWRSQYLTGFANPFGRNVSLHAFRAATGFVEPDSVDWVAKGAVTPVKNQAQCGSCWTFSTTGALEGASYIAGRGLTSLSEQNILDCDKGGNKCQGGSMDQAFTWVAENGLCSEAEDTYKCADQASSECASSTCPTSCTQVLKSGDVTGHTDVDQTEGALEAAVAQQPVSVAIEADQSVFQHYTGGVLTDDACGKNLDHGVLAVGYGTDKGQKYWKVKNSWGTTFGENGYIRIEKGQAADGGECGIRKMASFPTVAAAKHEIIV